MDKFVVTPEMLTAVAGVLLSLGFNYIPKLNENFAALEKEVKRLIMAGLLLLVTLGVFGGQYFGLWDAGFVMDKAGIMQLVWSFVFAVIANQSVFSITPQTAAVKYSKPLC